MPFSVAHAERIVVQSEEVTVLTNQHSVVEMMENQSYLGPAVTAFLDLKPIGVFGFVVIWNGVAEAWLMPDERLRTIPVTLTRIGKKVMDIAMISMGLHRIQLTVRTTDKRAERWAYAIGFQQEAVMRKYGTDGVDYFLMSRI